MNMETREQIARLNERQVELQAIMAKSDKHLWGCLKKLLDLFREEYPADFEEYTKANAEYNENEERLKELNLIVESEELIEHNEEV